MKKYPPGTFIPFLEYFPKTSIWEVRKVSLLQEMYGLPPGLYFLFESYCADKNCDCRKVMINVVPEGDTLNILDTIGFGWEDEDFYTKWVDDEITGKKMVGAYLEPGSIGIDRSEKYLNLVKNSLRDPHYVKLIKKHYKRFKNLLKTDNK